MTPRIVIALIAGFVAGCDRETEQVQSTNASEVVAPIVPEEVIEAWGYRTISTATVPQSEWEAHAFGAASIRTQAIKATAEVPEWKDAYYRFTLVEESLDSDGVARSRFERLRDHDPGRNSKMHPELILRDGFVVANRVLYATTDSTKFEIEAMPSVVASFEAHVLRTGKGEQD